MTTSVVTRLTWMFAAFLVCLVIAANLGWLGALPRMLTGRGLDKFGHFALFGMLAFLLGLVPRRDGRRPDVTCIAQRTVVLTAVVTMEELSQILIETRSFSYADLAADLFGIALGALAAWRSGGLVPEA